MLDTLLSVLYFAAFSHAAMIAIVLIRRSGRSGPGALLATLMGLLGYKLLEGTLHFSGLYRQFAHMMDLMPGVALLLGPVFYAYLRRLTGHPPHPWWLWAIQLIPAIVVWVLNAPHVFQPLDGKVLMWEGARLDTPGPVPPLAFTLLLTIKLVLLAYLVLGWRLINRYAARIDALRADDSRSLLTHMRFLAISFLSLETVWVGLFLGQQFLGLGTLDYVGSAWLLFIAAIVLIMGYRGLQDANFHLSPEERSLALTPLEDAAPSGADEPKVKYLHSALPDSAASEIADLIETRLDEHQDFLDEKLTLTALASSIGMKAHTVSQVINQHMGTNFYKLVNGYRVQHAINLISDPHAHFPLERIAVEAGFSNRVTFNKAFRGLTGQTPSSYRKGLTKAVRL